MAERRRYSRVAMPVFFRAPRLRNLVEPVVDIGQGGLRIFSDEPMTLGELFELELFLPTGQEVSCIVRVAWIGALPPDSAAAYDVGFEILDMNRSARAALENVLEPSTDEPRPGGED